MAVPKKRTSKSKRRSRLAKWSEKATIQAKKALSLAKSLANLEATSFIYSSTSNTETEKGKEN
jgi:large subunit ribosomal protein L32